MRFFHSDVTDKKNIIRSEYMAQRHPFPHLHRARLSALVFRQFCLPDQISANYPGETLPAGRGEQAGQARLARKAGYRGKKD